VTEQPRVVVVTGYVEIPGHPRGPDEYHHLGGRLGELRAAPVRPFRCALSDCWLSEHVRDSDVAHSVADNPKKNTLAYHVVQHQKTAWLVRAMETDPRADVLVWIDYGILHQPRVTPRVIDDFLQKVHNRATRTAVEIPGVWERSGGSHATPDWRFCGSALVAPRSLVQSFHEAVREVTLERLEADQHVTWEVNDWAQVERRGLLPIRWYKADHDQSQFTNY
jgi:hypothetical protein